MKKLKQQVYELIDKHFDEKIRDVNWYYDLSAKYDIIDIVNECLQAVNDAITDCDNSIDEYLENFEEEHWKDKQEEDKLVLDDMRTQDRMEEDLWN